MKNKSKIAIIIGMATALVLTATFAWANENLGNFSVTATTRNVDMGMPVLPEINRHRITNDEVRELKQMIGIYKEGKNYNIAIDGHGTGLRPPTEEGWEQIVKEAYVVDNISRKTSQLTQFPSSIDHTDDIWFPPIGNQDGEGSCVCWAVGYYTKTYQEAKEHGWDLSGAEWEGGYYGHPTSSYQDRIFSPDFIYHQINSGVDHGSSYYDAMNLIYHIGACSWEKMPYDPDDSTSWPSESAWREAPLYRGITGYNYMWLGSDSDINDLKNFSANDRLAVMSIDANQYSDLTGDDLWTIDNYVDPNTNHANTIVGYDDNFGPYNEEGETRYGAFKIANSWGTGWSGDHNNDGCYWISYEAMKERVGYCMFFDDRIGYEPEYVSVFQIDHSKRKECDITLGIGNTSNPYETKIFAPYWNAGNYPFPSNNIVFDITEFNDSISDIGQQNFFLQVYDSGSITTGTITHFSIEYYENYMSRIPVTITTSDDPPIDTINNEDVFAEIVFPGSTIFLTIHRIKVIDDIENWPEGDGPDWYYKIWVYGYNNTWQSDRYVCPRNNNDIVINKTHFFGINRLNTTIKIKLMEDDTWSGDDLADVSGYPGGGVDHFTPDKRGAIYYGYYNLTTNNLTGDTTYADGDWSMTSGDYPPDNSTNTDENDAKIWFNIIDNYKLPVADAGNNKTVVAGETATFNASNSTASDGSSIIMYEWDWDNDGSYDESYITPTADHIWTEEDNYTVVIRVTDNYGETSTDNCQITVIPPPDIWVSPEKYNITTTKGSITNKTLTIGNNGTTVLEFDILYSNVFHELLSEKFSTEPTNWTITHVDGTAWAWNNQRMENAYGYPNSGYLDSPVIDYSGRTGVNLSFWHYWKADWTGGIQDGYVRGSIDGGSTFPYLIDEFHHLNPATETAVKNYTLPWADNQASVRIRFDIYNYDDWYWYIDDFNLSSAFVMIEWLSMNSVNGTVDEGKNTSVTLTINATKLEIGTYHANISIFSNDPDENPIVVPICLNVTLADHDIGVTNMNVDTPYLHEETVINATIENKGLNNETNITVQLLVNGSIVNNTTINKLNISDSINVSLSWTSNSTGKFNVTIYAVPVPSENITYDNSMSRMVMILPIYVWIDDDFNSSTPGWNVTHFDKIQDGIYAVAENGTVYVFNGTYFENVIVNKTINLTGEDRNTTIIDGSRYEGVVQVSADWTNISGFTIKDIEAPSYGIELGYVNNCIISDCILKDNYIGVGLWNSHDNSILNCEFYNLTSYFYGYGIEIRNNSDDNIISKCTISNTNYGIRLGSSGNNTISGNTITNNSDYGIELDSSSDNNHIYHNNFIGNTQNAYDEGDNTWYNATLQEGNYWSDFDEPSEGAYDNNSDGIVDSPYDILGGGNQDKYPMMDPWNITPVTTFVNISPSTQTVFSGETFTVNITIDPGEPITGARADLLFDPSLITVNSVTDGGMFGMWFDLNLEIDNVNGTVWNMSAFDFGSVTTPGVFAVIEFTADSIDGTSPLNLTNVIVGDPDANPVNITINNGSVTVALDTTPPEIIDNTPTIATTGDPFTFNATVTDNIGVSHVYVYYWYGTGTATNVSMIATGIDDYYEYTIIIPSNSIAILHYNISAVDDAGNWNQTGQKDVPVTDNDTPEISNVNAEPDPQEVNGYVNITCDVTDNVAVDEVWVNITYPDSTTHNFSMNPGSYYFNQTYSILGTYHYFIWANDTSGNANTSGPYQFVIVPTYGSISGTIRYGCNGTAISGAIVNLTQNGILINSTTTDSNGNYTFDDLEPGEYNITAWKPYFWKNSTSLIVKAGEENIVDLTLLLIGDLDNNGNVADAVDVTMMVQASVGDIPPIPPSVPIKYYDLDRNGVSADAVDVTMMIQASVGDIPDSWGI